MKFFELLKLSTGKKATAQILITLELLVGLLVFYVCANMLYNFQLEDYYTEKYGNIAVIECSDPKQVAYAKANGTLFTAGKDLDLRNVSNSQYLSASLNSLEYYNAIPLDLAKGQWFCGDFKDSDFVAVVPYSLGNKYKCGRMYSFDIYEIGEVDVFICGVLSADITLGNSGVAAFDDINRKILLYNHKGFTQSIEEDLEGRAYAELKNVNEEELKALGITTVGLEAERVQKGHKNTVAVPIIFTAILFVLFTVGFIGEHSLSMMEHEKLYAVQFICGASPGRSLTMQMCADFVWLLIPFVLSCIGAKITGLRLHWFGVLIPFTYLLLSIGVITAWMILSFSKKSLINIIKRRFRS